ncbi:MAG: hypothetical protein WCS37_08070 [Chloroflexota bacterium]
MSKISDANYETIRAFRNKAQESLKQFKVLEEAAQSFTDLIYQEFEESIALVRVYVTFPFGKLPSSNQTRITNLATAKQILPILNEKSTILSLLGTHGEKAAWNNRHNSQGHIGIPLVSADFIDSIPMVSRLLKEMGVPLEWVTSQNTGMEAKNTLNIASVFYVPDASTALDQRGRKIIPAQDFVKASGIKTVFGSGGTYLMSNSFATIIIFCRESLTKEQASQFLSLASLFTFATARLVLNGKIFVDN